MSDDNAADDENLSGRKPHAPPVIRTGCVLLGALGVLSFIFAGSSLMDPPTVQCSIARAMIETANDDNKDFNNVDTGGQKPAQLECNGAVALAGRIPTDREGRRRTSVPSEAAIRTRASVVAIVGLGQAVSGFLTARTLDRRARTVALAFTGFGILFSALGILSAAVLVFVFYALAFSAASRTLWGRRGGGAGSRPPDPSV